MHQAHYQGSREVEGAGEEDSNRLENAWSKRHRGSDAFHHARAGEHLLIPFECDRCIFLKLKGKLPDERDPRDELLEGCIRRMNLDCFWSRETQSVVRNARRAEIQLEMSSLVGLEGPYVHRDRLPEFDHCGYEVAIGMLLHSRRPGRHSKSYTQFDTIRHLRSTYSNFVRASPRANGTSMSLGDFKGNYQRLVTDECGSMFFKRFVEGLKRRMGQDWRPNTALSTDLLLEILNKIEIEIEDSNDEEKHNLIVFRAYIAVTYCVSLRGPEGFLLDLEGLNKHWRSSNDYIVIALLGRVKGEHHDLAHLIPCVTKTRSGIQMKQIIQDLINIKSINGFRNGPAISDIRGRIFNSSFINDLLVEFLTSIFDENRDLFPGNILNRDQIKDRYQCFRSFRRGSDTRALEKKIDGKDIDVVNRWRTIEQARGQRPSMQMQQHYAQLDQILAPFLRYTLEM